MPYLEIYERTNTPSITALLGQKHRRWVGHVIRMPAHHLTRQILYGQLLKKCNIKPPALESLAVDCHTWSSPCHQGITHLQKKIAERRVQRHAQRPNVPLDIRPPLPPSPAPPVTKSVDHKQAAISKEGSVCMCVCVFLIRASFFAIRREVQLRQLTVRTKHIKRRKDESFTAGRQWQWIARGR